MYYQEDALFPPARIWHRAWGSEVSPTKIVVGLYDRVDSHRGILEVMSFGSRHVSEVPYGMKSHPSGDSKTMVSIVFLACGPRELGGTGRAGEASTGANIDGSEMT